MSEGLSRHMAYACASLCIGTRRRGWGARGFAHTTTVNRIPYSITTTLATHPTNTPPPLYHDSPIWNFDGSSTGQAPG